MPAATPTGHALSQKIRWLLNSISKADLARACGVKPPSVNGWADTGRVAKKHLPTFARLSGTTLEWWIEEAAPVPPTEEWLTTGVGSMGKSISSSPSSALLSAPDPADDISIPLLDVRASAGLGAQQPDHDPMLGTLRLSIPWMQRHLRTITSPGNLACLFAYGPSMQPTFADGSILIVDVGVREVKVDAIYVLQRNDELYVKRLQRRLDGTMLMISDNPHYPPETLTPDGKYSMQVLGRVVWAFDSKGV